jgi:3-oxoacyl-[acyl-carrier protein] reductase
MAGTLAAAFDLSDRPAIVTGAASGIGRGVALRLAEAGAVVTCADVNGVGAKETAAAIADAGGRSTSAQVDVSSRREVEELVASVAGLAIMCNVAGIMRNNTILDLPDEELDQIMGVNFFGVLYGSQAAARAMVPLGRGSIINMLSGAVDNAAPTIGAYAISKAAGRQLTMTMAVELAGAGVRVNAVAPGLVVSGITARHYTRPDGTEDAQAKAAYHGGMMKNTPLNMVGEPDDIAYAVLYLASDASRFMTGQVLRPNGGVAMPG